MRLLADKTYEKGREEGSTIVNLLREKGNRLTGNEDCIQTIFVEGIRKAIRRHAAVNPAELSEVISDLLKGDSFSSVIEKRMLKEMEKKQVITSCNQKVQFYQFF